MKPRSNSYNSYTCDTLHSMFGDSPCSDDWDEARELVNGIKEYVSRSLQPGDSQLVEALRQRNNAALAIEIEHVLTSLGNISHRTYHIYDAYEDSGAAAASRCNNGLAAEAITLAKRLADARKAALKFLDSK